MKLRTRYLNVEKRKNNSRLQVFPDFVSRTAFFKCFSSFLAQLPSPLRLRTSFERHPVMCMLARETSVDSLFCMDWEVKKQEKKTWKRNEERPW